MLTFTLKTFLMVNLPYEYNRSSQAMEYIELVGDVEVISQNGILECPSLLNEIFNKSF
jgi:hypothetical protein